MSHFADGHLRAIGATPATRSRWTPPTPAPDVERELVRRVTSWSPLLRTPIWLSGVAPTTRCGSRALLLQTQA